MKRLQDYIMIFQKGIFLNAIIFSLLKQKKMNSQKRDSKYKTKNLFLEDYDYDDWLK